MIKRNAIENEIFDYWRKQNKKILNAKAFLQKNGYIVYKKNEK